MKIEVQNKTDETLVLEPGDAVTLKGDKLRRRVLSSRKTILRLRDIIR